MTVSVRKMAGVGVDMEFTSTHAHTLIIRRKHAFTIDLRSSTLKNDRMLFFEVSYGTNILINVNIECWGSMKNSALSYTSEGVYVEIQPFLEGDATVCSYPWITQLLGHFLEVITADAHKICKVAQPVAVKMEKLNVLQAWNT